MKEGMALYAEGRYSEALASFLVSDVDTKDYPVFSYYMGLTYLRLKKYEEALLYLEQVVSGDLDFPHLYQSRMLLGFIYSETRRLRLSIFEFRKLLDDGFESVKVYAALGHVLYLDQRLEESLDALDKALALDPENPNALNSMGYILAESGSRLNLAFVYCSRAVRHNPRNPAYWDSLAWVMFKQGKTGEARDILRTALRLAPGNPVITKHFQTVAAALPRS